jgi:hypothetical protein
VGGKGAAVGAGWAKASETVRNPSAMVKREGFIEKAEEATEG